MNIAILGYGVVGSGVFEALERNRAHVERKAGQAVTVTRVLDIRDFPGEPVKQILTDDYGDILNDAGISVVVETMGGLEPAYTYVRQALMSGKHVCTSNKELVCARGAELLALAKERELNFLFEASVGGGIPIIRPLTKVLTTDEVTGITGILNGTTNYILTRMASAGMDFGGALAEAQALGYAERNPDADVLGLDASRKLAILMSLAVGRQVGVEKIRTEGITRLSAADFAFAEAFGYTVKLLADGRISAAGDNINNTEYTIEAETAPMLVHHSNPLRSVQGVFNAVSVRTAVTGEVTFVGQGAGRLPTAGAVVSDIVDIAKHPHRHIPHDWSPEPAAVAVASGYIKSRLARITYNDRAVSESVRRAAGGTVFRELPEFPGQMAWLTPREPERETARRLDKITRMPDVTAAAEPLAVYEPVNNRS